MLNLPENAKRLIENLEADIAQRMSFTYLQVADFQFIQERASLIEQVRYFFSEKNGSKNCSNEQPSGAAPAVTADEDNTRGWARTSDLRFRKPNQGESGAIDTDPKSAISPTPAERFTLWTPQTNTDTTQTHTDKLLQLEQLKNSVLGFRVAPLRDDQGRRLIHIPYDGHTGLPVALRLGGISYGLIKSVAPFLCMYREITPEEESHLEENRVDTGHDGILA